MPRPSSPYDDVEIFGNLGTPAIPVGPGTRVDRTGRGLSESARRAEARAKEAAARRRAVSGRSRPTAVTPRNRNERRGGRRLEQNARNAAAKAVRRAVNNISRRNIQGGRRGRR
jgi:hypothetical protein